MHSADRALPRQVIETLMSKEKITQFLCALLPRRSTQNIAGRRVSKGVRGTTLKIYDWLVPSRPLKEEAQAAAVSGFLSFVPFQMLKWTRPYSREVISIRSKKNR